MSAAALRRVEALATEMDERGRGRAAADLREVVRLAKAHIAREADLKKFNATFMRWVAEGKPEPKRRAKR